MLLSFPGSGSALSLHQSPCTAPIQTPAQQGEIPPPPKQNHALRFNEGRIGGGVLLQFQEHLSSQGLITEV